MPKYHILIVDDNHPFCTVVKHMLGEQDYEFAVAGSAEDAITLYMKQAFDLILLDVMLPEMDGVACLKKMREFKPDDDTPVIFMSARTDKQTIFQGLELGAIEYLTKPIDYTELKIRVASLLRMRKLQVDLRVHERAIAEHKALSEMLITLSHYINNAASSILLLADVMDQDDPARIQEFRTVVKRQTEIIVNVIRSLQKMVTDGTMQKEGYASETTMIALKEILANQNQGKNFFR